MGGKRIRRVRRRYGEIQAALVKIDLRLERAWLTPSPLDSRSIRFFPARQFNVEEAMI